jgi:hypothetical protein
MNREQQSARHGGMVAATGLPKLSSALAALGSVAAALWAQGSALSGRCAAMLSVAHCLLQHRVKNDDQRGAAWQVSS